MAEHCTAASNKRSQSSSGLCINNESHELYNKEITLEELEFKIHNQ